jgi:4-amino-4-deoxy-L-arabinose transferase-like glycosyltransferase
LPFVLNNIKRFSFIYKLLIAFILLALVLFPTFYNLHFLSIQPWDEALFALRAYFLYSEGKVLQHFSEITPMLNYPNSKPVFITLFQALSMKVFGPSEFALRLPIALSFVAINLSFLYISKKTVNSYVVGIIAIVLFISTKGVNDYHMSRFGDHYIPFALFFLLFCYQSFQFMQNKKSINLILLILFFAIGFLTKSVAILMAFPAILVWIVMHGHFKSFIIDRRVLIALILVFSFLIINYFFQSYHFHNQERFTKVLEHQGPFWFYFSKFYNDNLLTPWIYFTPLLIIFLRNNKLMFYFTLQCLFILLIISLAQTKLYWYAAPLYPLFVFALSIALFLSYQWLSNKLPNLKLLWSISFPLSIILLAYKPYSKHIIEIIQPIDYCNTCRLGYVLRDAKSLQPHIKQITLLQNEEKTPNFFYYQRVYNQEYGYQIEVAKDFESVKTPYFICSQIAYDSLQAKLPLSKVILDYNGAKLIQIEP